MHNQETLAYVDRSIMEGKKFGQTVLLQFLEIFDSPQEKLRILHVAGTNGKGSVCAMLASILKQSGYKTGLFTSPHLDRYNERFRINGEVISDQRFAQYIETIEKASTVFFGNEKETFSFFELMTILAFLYFYDEGVDFLILETGIGGRLDSTNVITKPVLSIITAIGMDHMEYLGNTIDEITAEKAGIIKKNSPVVLYFQTDEVYNKIKNISQDNHAVLYALNTECSVQIHSEDLTGTSFTVHFQCNGGPSVSYEAVRLQLLGSYQVYNACTVLLAVEALRNQGIRLETSQVMEGLYQTRWPGRLEIVGYEPLLILDGAHNESGARILNEDFKHYFEGKELVLITGVLADKEYVKIMESLTEQAWTVIITQPENKRAYPAEKLYELVKTMKQAVYLESDYRKAVKLALQLAGTDRVVACAGSLYLIGDVRRLLKNRGEGYVGL